MAEDAENDKAKSTLSRKPIKSFADLERVEQTISRWEERVEERNAPFTRELQSIFDELDLPPLPSPLPKAIWESLRAPWLTYINKEVEPFTIACQEGQLETVRCWATEKKDLLGQVGLQFGLALAAWKDHTSTVHYLLGEGGAFLDSAVIEMACDNLSTAMFQVAIEHGYHPNQQIPSRSGHLSIALIQCLENYEVTKYLLAHGADPDLGRWQDFRRQPWKEVRAAPPMDRQCGIALDIAVRKGNLALTELLLNHGAHVNYARPIHELISRKIDAEEQQWRPFMDLLCRHGLDVNASKASRGNPYRGLHFAVHMHQWKLVEELLVRGADPFLRSRPNGWDAFQEAADNTPTITERARMMNIGSGGEHQERPPSDDARIFSEIYERVKTSRNSDKENEAEK